MQYSVVEMPHLIKNYSFKIQKYSLCMYFSNSQKHFILYIPLVCLLTFF